MAILSIPFKEEVEMIIIQNISEKYSKTGDQEYALWINNKLVCFFNHRALGGLAKCLEDAAEAVRLQDWFKKGERI